MKWLILSFIIFNPELYAIIKAEYNIEQEESSNDEELLDDSSQEINSSSSSDDFEEEFDQEDLI